MPDAAGHFGPYGGRFVPEALMAALDQLDAAYRLARRDPDFVAELERLGRDYTGRPNPLTPAERFTADHGGARLYLKREDLNHTGSHKINNVLGQALLTKRMGKTRLIAETGAGQHGVATATAAALMGLECVVYMGAEDTRRQALNVARMRLLGPRSYRSPLARRRSGRHQRGDARLGGQRRRHPLSAGHRGGTGALPGDGARLPRGHRSRDSGPDPGAGGPAARRGGGVRRRWLERHRHLLGVPRRSGGGALRFRGRGRRGGYAAPRGYPDRRGAGVLHGTRSYLLQDDEGQTIESHSISAGLDYPGVGPEHAWLRDSGRAHYEAITDAEAMDAFALLCRTEGIMPAIETAHALAGALKLSQRLGPEGLIVVNLSGRGDKDVHTAAAWFGMDLGEGA